MRAREREDGRARDRGGEGGRGRSQTPMARNRSAEPSRCSSRSGPVGCSYKTVFLHLLCPRTPRRQTLTNLERGSSFLTTYWSESTYSSR
jgi:hypothetical protein